MLYKLHISKADKSYYKKLEEYLSPDLMTYSSQQSYEVSCNVFLSNNCEASFGELDPVKIKLLLMTKEQF